MTTSTIGEFGDGLAAEAAIRLLGPGDEAALERFLIARAATSMFLRSNVRAAGLLDEGGHLQATYAAASDAAGYVVAVVAHCWNGMLLLQAPSRGVEVARAAVLAARRPVAGIIGPWEQVTEVRHGLGLDASPAKLDSVEDLFDLELSSLRVPSQLERGEVACRRADVHDVEAFARLQRDYAVEALGESPGAALLEARVAAARRLIDAGDAFVLARGHDVVACSTFNARLPDCVQVGGVYTPSATRGQGLARCVVAGSLLLARAEGATRSILFTGKANEPARRAYLSLGYRIIGEYGLVVLREPSRVE